MAKLSKILRISGDCYTYTMSWWRVTAPWRRTSHPCSVHSTTVDGKPLPNSCVSSSPSAKVKTSAKFWCISIIFLRGGRLLRLALVVNSAPVCCKMEIATAQSGIRTPKVAQPWFSACPRSLAGSTRVKAPAKYLAAIACQVLRLGCAASINGKNCCQLAAIKINGLSGDRPFKW